MADDTIASVIALHQPKRARNGAQRVRASRPRKRQKAKPAAWPDAESPSSETLIPAGFSSADSAFAGSPDAPSPTVTLAAVTPSHRSLASIFLVAAAFALAGVGITTNGWFARSLGSSAVAGWLFLTIGVATDLVALVMPSCAAGLWHSCQRATCLVAWAVWAMTFALADTAGIGFASVNITDVAAARAGRVTPAITAAQTGITGRISSP